jgi:carboxyl-terminal processing protease
MHNDDSIVKRSQPLSVRAGALALFALAICGLSPTFGAAAVAQQPTPTISVTPTEYLRQALDFIEAQALRRSKVDWATIRSTAETRVKKATALSDTYPIITDVFKQLGDPHSSFRAPAKATEITTGQANGYGFLASWPDRTVVSLTDGGPAATAGLRLRDQIELIEGRKPVGSRQVVAIPAKTKVKDQLRLTILRKGDGAGKPKRLSLTIRKGNISLATPPKQDPAVTKGVGDRLGYIELPGLLGTEQDQQIYAQAAHDAIRDTEATPRCGWIVDVRRNRGGWVYPILAATAPLFGTAPDTVLMGKTEASGTTETWSYRRGEVHVTRPGANPPDYGVFTVGNPFAVTHPVSIAVLTTGLTASAGEAVALSYRGKSNSRSFGQKTLGLTTFNVVGTLPDGALLLVSNAAMTDQTFVAQDGPITPEVQIEPDWNHFADAEDPILNSAVQWLNAQPACQS